MAAPTIAASGGAIIAESRKTLPAALAVTSAELPSDGLSKLHLATMRSNGTLEVEVNDPDAALRVDALIDGDLSTLARSNGINPLVVTLTLAEPVLLKAVRVFATHSPHDWVLEPLPSEGRLLIQNAPGHAWSTIELEEPRKTSVIRVEVLRLERDDYVHLNDIELYV